MTIEVLIEKMANGYRATTLGPLGESADAPTREEALRQVRDAVNRKVAAGAEVVTMDIPGPPHPLAAVAGWLKDEQLFGAWVQAMEDNRRERAREEEPPPGDDQARAG
ncbi:MAG: hypothetical protein ACRC33_30855 [Gemmataceae bacterium]